MLSTSRDVYLTLHVQQLTGQLWALLRTLLPTKERTMDMLILGKSRANQSWLWWGKAGGESLQQDHCMRARSLGTHSTEVVSQTQVMPCAAEVGAPSQLQHRLALQCSWGPFFVFLPSAKDLRSSCSSLPDIAFMLFFPRLQPRPHCPVT